MSTDDSPMVPPDSPSAPRHSGAALARTGRLFTGLVLLLYVLTHLANSALGLVSLGAMESGRDVFILLWRSAAGTILFYGSLLAHVALSLWSQFQRHHFRIPLWEATQIVLGLGIPPLLVSHIVGTRLAHEWFGTTDSYTAIVLVFWELRPDYGLRQAFLVAVVWAHGCLGVHYWLRLRTWYARHTAALFGFALLLPVLALLGLSQAGREVAVLAQGSGWVQKTLQTTIALEPSQSAWTVTVRDGILTAYAVCLALAFLLRGVRHLHQRSRRTIRISYPGGRSIAVPAGFSVLEASRLLAIPHASICGGRGRCSTCRVRVVSGQESLPSPTIEEQHVLEHIQASPNVRLACQLRPTANISVSPILTSNPKLWEDLEHPIYLDGEEREIVVLFADLRGFTTIAERKLPYDVVFLLNRYFDAVGGAIESAGGVANQYTGDGVMALFAVKNSVAEGSRQALTAAGQMVRNLEALSEEVAQELKEPLKVGIGIHAGPAVVGHMGHGVAMYLTAVGDTVHVASRLQELTKEYACRVIISEAVAELAGIDPSCFPRHELSVRNRRDPIWIRTIDEPHRLEEVLGRNRNDALLLR